MISDQLEEGDIFKLILYSSIPFMIWVTWDAGNRFFIILDISIID